MRWPTFGALMGVVCICFSISAVASEALSVPTIADQTVSLLATGGYKLDYSVKSLSEIDRFFDEQSDNGQPRDGGLLSNDIDQRLFGLGAYLGEVLIRACGGSWTLSASSPTPNAAGIFIAPLERCDGLADGPNCSSIRTRLRKWNLCIWVCHHA